MTRRELIKAIKNWDGESLKDLAGLVPEFSDNSNELEILTETACAPEYQLAALWLIKNQVEKGTALTNESERLLISQCLDLGSWESTLHMLQIIPYCDLSNVDRDLVETFVRRSLGSDNKFVRAWAMNCFYLLAENFAEYRGEVRVLIDHALENESASVKARVRNMIKKGFYSM